LDGHEDARQKVVTFYNTLGNHLTAIEQRLKELGGSPTHPLKQGVAAVAGVAAGVVDKMRTSEAAKDLRDDYTAVNHAIIAYEMMYTTAVAAGDQQTADLCKRHLKDNAGFVMEINNFMPKLVLDELREDGLQVKDGAQAQAEQMVHEIWQQPPHVMA
ncbi:MAG TPA: DUF892 family protein, partial [Chloroflexota bacterium]|nr:DUF892 family protein [Chloroflexota bacterium]